MSESKYELSFDSGSSEIVFPFSLCQALMTFLRDKKTITCSYISEIRNGEGIYCSENIDFFEISFHAENNQIVTLKGDHLIER